MGDYFSFRSLAIVFMKNEEGDDRVWIFVGGFIFCVVMWPPCPVGGFDFGQTSSSSKFFHNVCIFILSVCNKTPQNSVLTVTHSRFFSPPTTTNDDIHNNSAAFAFCCWQGSSSWSSVSHFLLVFCLPPAEVGWMWRRSEFIFSSSALRQHHLNGGRCSTY